MWLIELLMKVDDVLKVVQAIKDGADTTSGENVIVNIHHITNESKSISSSSSEYLAQDFDTLVIGIPAYCISIPNEIQSFLDNLPKFILFGSLKGKIASCFIVGKINEDVENVVTSVLTVLDGYGMILTPTNNIITNSSGSSNAPIKSSIGNIKDIIGSLASSTFSHTDSGLKCGNDYGKFIAQYTKYFKTGRARLSMTHTVHTKSHPLYPARTAVQVVSWTRPDSSYNPIEFTHDKVLRDDFTKKQGGLADPPNISLIPKEQWFARKSHCGQIEYDANGYPRNPIGRTGMRGRGVLRKWGPNHAADIIVTRIKPGTSNVIQMVAIQRGDTKIWAIPGGKIENGESVEETLRREFTEEAGNVSSDLQPILEQQLDALFSSRSVEIFRGYVDDPRNTDQAWMETVAVHFHCSTELGKALHISAGDDAVSVQWLDVDERVPEFANLYASHKMMVLEAAKGVAHRFRLDEENIAASKLQHAFREHRQSTKQHNSNDELLSIGKKEQNNSILSSSSESATGKMHGDNIYSMENDAAKTLQSAFRGRKSRASDLSKKRDTFTIGKSTFNTAVKKLQRKHFETIEEYIAFLKS